MYFCIRTNNIGKDPYVVLGVKARVHSEVKVEVNF